MPYEQALRDVKQLRAFYTAGWLEFGGGIAPVFFRV